MKEKLKSWFLNDQIFYGLIVILVSLISFLLGQASIAGDKNYNEAEVRIIEPMVLNSNNFQKIEIKTTDDKNYTANSKQKRYVASKNGTKYYLDRCSGVKRIKPENIIYFSTIGEAEAAGYSKAANCPGL